MEIFSVLGKIFLEKEFFAGKSGKK